MLQFSLYYTTRMCFGIHTKDLMHEAVWSCIRKVNKIIITRRATPYKFPKPLNVIHILNIHNRNGSLWNNIKFQNINKQLFDFVIYRTAIDKSSHAVYCPRLLAIL